MKALILVNSTPRERPRLLERLKAEFGHNLDALRREAARRGVHLGPAERAAFVPLNSWNNNIRYEARVQSLQAGRAVLAAAEVLFQWAEGRRGKT